MKLFIILSHISLLLLFSCSEVERQTDSISENKFDKSDEKMTIIYDTTCKMWFGENNYTHYKPTNNDIDEVDLILEKAIKNGEFDFLRNPDLKIVKEYHRQYVCYLDKNEHKIIRINAFCRNIQTPTEINGEFVWKPYDWKSNILIIHGGGACYWTIFIDLNTKTYFDLTLN